MARVSLALFVMHEETNMWEECQLSVGDASVAIAQPSSGGARASGSGAIELLGCRLVEYPDGRPGKGSLISSNCLHLIPQYSVESPVLLKAQSRADYHTLVAALKRALSARAENALLESLEEAIVRSENVHADALLESSMAMLAAATAAAAPTTSRSPAGVPTGVPSPTTETASGGARL
jgi:hypothetical protein